MKQHNKSNKRINSLDAEKIYFIEKFGYLIRKINGNYGNAIQNALFGKISTTVDNFRIDLPNILQNLKKDRLKSASYQNKVEMEIKDKESNDNFVGFKKSVEEKETVNQKIDIIYKAVTDEIKAKSQQKYEKLQERSTVKKISDDVHFSKQPRTIESKSRILRKSLAIIMEEERKNNIMDMPQKEELSSTKSVSKNPSTQSKAKSVSELTEWEKRWHEHISDRI